MAKHDVKALAEDDERRERHQERHGVVDTDRPGLVRDAVCRGRNCIGHHREPDVCWYCGRALNPNRRPKMVLD